MSFAEIFTHHTKFRVNKVLLSELQVRLKHASNEYSQHSFYGEMIKYQYFSVVKKQIQNTVMWSYVPCMYIFLLFTANKSHREELDNILHIFEVNSYELFYKVIFI